jgi:hypothetical protein
MTEELLQMHANDMQNNDEDSGSDDSDNNNDIINNNNNRMNQQRQNITHIPMSSLLSQVKSFLPQLMNANIQLNTEIAQYGLDKYQIDADAEEEEDDDDNEENITNIQYKYNKTNENQDEIDVEDTDDINSDNETNEEQKHVEMQIAVGVLEAQHINDTTITEENIVLPTSATTSKSPAKNGRSKAERTQIITEVSNEEMTSK